MKDKRYSHWLYRWREALRSVSEGYLSARPRFFGVSSVDATLRFVVVSASETVFAFEVNDRCMVGMQRHRE
jgi:hypothetical protein